MTGYSTQLSGEFLRAVTPTGTKYLIPFWTADQEQARAQVERHGVEFDAPKGIVPEESKRPFGVRVFLDAKRYKTDLMDLEKPGIIDFISNARQIQFIPADPKQVPELVAVQAHILPAALEAVAQDPRVAGMRPHNDPHFLEIVKGLEKSFSAPTPAVA